MALRIRKNGNIVCAALNNTRLDDIYIDDTAHYILSVDMKLLVTQPEPEHTKNDGVWWWKGQEPKGIVIDSFYLQ